jgi:multidrug efflux pump
MTGAYRRTLHTFMERRWLSLGIMAACIGLIALFYTTLPEELAPLEDRSSVRMFATAREGATFQYMDNYVNRLFGTVKDVAGEDLRAVISVTSPGFGASTSVNSAFMRLQLVEPAQRDRTQMEVADQLTQAVSQLEGARTYVSQEQTISIGFGQGLPVQYVLQAPNLDELKSVLPAFLERAQQEEAFAFVDVNLKFNKPELEVTIDRDRANNIGVSPLDVAQTLQLALSEQRIGYFVRDGEQREIVAQVEQENRNETLDLTSLYVRSASGEPVLLDNLVSVTERPTPPQLFRFNRYRSATISAQLAPGFTIADGINAMDNIAGDVLPESFATSLSGPSRDFTETSNRLLYVFILALVLIYLVLAAQFESFRDPFIILLTVPLALAGAFLFLWYFNQSINIFSQIGLVMLIGLVAKNGILIVEFANQRKAAGLSIREAIEDAAAARFRPILMTALSTTLGVLPIALALGAGAQSRIPMGLAVIGGLLIGTALSLYVIPAMYTYLTSEEAGAKMATADVTAGDGMPGEGEVTRTEAERKAAQ